mmetsp:Transcript_33228/g.79579  ORF Transcript_33228/g.79579 Transcript_33228/m.79579 type:complete len:471 (+) Transcript_33228:273-1685(+)
MVEAGVPLPGELHVAGVAELQVPDAERALPEGRPRWLGAVLTRQPVGVRAFVVAAVANVNKHGPAGVGGILVHRPGAFVRMDVPGHHEIHSVFEKHVFQVLSHDLSLAEVAQVGVVPRRVHHHYQPRRLGAVEVLEVALQPLVLEAPGVRGAVAVQGHHMHRPNVSAPVGGIVGARLLVRHGVPHREAFEGLGGGVLVVPRASHGGHAGAQRLEHDAKGIPAWKKAVSVGQVSSHQHQFRVQLGEQVHAGVGYGRLPDIPHQADVVGILLALLRHGELELAVVIVHLIGVGHPGLQVRQNHRVDRRGVVPLPRILVPANVIRLHLLGADLAPGRVFPSSALVVGPAGGAHILGGSLSANAMAAGNHRFEERLAPEHQLRVALRLPQRLALQNPRLAEADLRLSVGLRLGDKGDDNLPRAAQMQMDLPRARRLTAVLAHGHRDFHVRVVGRTLVRAGLRACGLVGARKRLI